MSTPAQRSAAEHARYKKEEKRLVKECNKHIDSINRRLEREGRSDEKFTRLKYNPND